MTLSLIILEILLVGAGQTRPAPATCVVTGPAVVFYSPTAAERDSIIRADGLDQAELFDDFDYSAGKAAAFLKGRNIPLKLTSVPIIVVQYGQKKSRTLERAKAPDIIGIILTDGAQEPRLIPGLVTDEELITEVEVFFRRPGNPQ